MKSVGITGGIGSGKSIISRMFKLLHVPVFDADHQAKIIVNTDPQVRSEILDLLGPEAYHENGYNPKFVASKVFEDNDLLTSLNEIIHPAVGRRFNTWLKEQNAPYVLKEAALLFESGSYKSLNEVIVVISPKDLRLERIKKRDAHRTEEEILAIIDKQWNDEEKIRLANHVINNGHGDMIIPQVLALHHYLSKLA